MAKEIILSEDEQILLDFAGLLKSFVPYYGETKTESSNGVLKVTNSIPMEWVRLLENISKSKFYRAGCTRVNNEEAYRILYDFLMKSGDIADDSICCEAINLLENKLDYLCENGKTNIDKSYTYSIASEIVFSYFRPIASFGDEHLYYTDGDIQKIGYYLSCELNVSLTDVIMFPQLFIPKVMEFEPKYRLSKFLLCISCIDLKNSKKQNYTYIGTDSSGAYKIGRTSDLMQREKGIKTGNHSYRTVIFIKDDFEKELHDKFSDKRIRGEWFDLSDKDLKFITSNYDVIFNSFE